MINMTNRSYVYVRLTAIKFFLRHDSLRLIAKESIFVLRAPVNRHRLQRAACSY